MDSFIIVIPPWDVLVQRFGLSDIQPTSIASEDSSLEYAWSVREDSEEIGSNRELTVYPPNFERRRYYYTSTRGGSIDLPDTFVQFCVEYREKPLYGISITLGKTYD